MVDETAQAGRLYRVLRHPLSLLVGGFIGFLALYVLAGLASSGVRALRNTPLQVLIMLGFAVGAISLYRLASRRIERRDHDDFAAGGAGGELALGLGGGLLLFCAVVAVVMALGGFAIDGVRGAGRIWSMLAMGVGSSVFEELVFRGVVFRQLERVAGSGIALGLTSAFFGIMHLANPDATWFAALAIAAEAGILLGAAYMLTRRLWLPIGLHAGWNFTQGWIFSAPVSGGKAPDGLLVTRLHGPEWLTGGGFGLEASTVAVTLVTAAGIGMLVLAVRRGHYVPIRWGRGGAATGPAA